MHHYGNSFYLEDSLKGSFLGTPKGPQITLLRPTDLVYISLITSIFRINFKIAQYPCFVSVRPVWKLYY